MSVNILNKEIKKKLIPLSLPCVHFIIKGLGSCPLKKNKKRTLVNVLNKKIKKKEKKSNSPPPGLPCVHFILKGTGKNVKMVWMKFFHYFHINLQFLLYLI